MGYQRAGNCRRSVVLYHAKKKYNKPQFFLICLEYHDEYRNPRHVNCMKRTTSKQCIANNNFDNTSFTPHRIFIGGGKKIYWSNYIYSVRRRNHNSHQLLRNAYPRPKIHVYEYLIITFYNFFFSPLFT